MNARIPSDDAPENDGPWLNIVGGDDWYVSVIYHRLDGLRTQSEAVRFCMSGERDIHRSMAVALLAFLGAGEKGRARGVAASLVRMLADAEPADPSNTGGGR